MRDRSEHTDADRPAFDRMTEAEPKVLDVYQLIQRFIGIVRERRDRELTGWIQDARMTGPVPFQRFAEGLMQDFDAVNNALLLPWSNGQVEGQVNRLKLIKRQMYGRAGFDLLRKRVLGYRMTA